MRWGLVVLCWGVYEGRRVAFGWVGLRVVWCGSVRVLSCWIACHILTRALTLCFVEVASLDSPV